MHSSGLEFPSPFPPGGIAPILIFPSPIKRQSRSPWLLSRGDERSVGSPDVCSLLTPCWIRTVGEVEALLFVVFWLGTLELGISMFCFSVRCFGVAPLPLP
jgi:hypothetical protein